MGPPPSDGKGADRSEADRRRGTQSPPQGGGNGAGQQLTGRRWGSMSDE